MKINQLKAGVFLSYFTQGIQIVISLLYTPFMLRVLGQSEYGLYQLVFSVVSYLGLLSFGFGSAYMRFYSRCKVREDKEGIAKLNGMFMVVFLVISGITLIAGSVLVINVQTIFGKSLTAQEISIARVLMTLMVVNIAITFPTSVFDCNITAHEQYFFQRIVSLLQAILNPFLTLPLLLLGFKSIGLVVVSTILTVLKLAINIWYCTKKLHIKFIFKNFNFGLLKEIWIFSFYIFLNLIVDQINWSVDKFLLGTFRGTISVAVYGVASQLNTYYMSISTLFSSVFIPRVNQLVANGNNDRELTYLFTRVGRMQFIIISLALLGIIFYGEPFISIWAGNNYKDSFIILLVLIIPATISLIQNLGIEIQRAKNLHKFRSWLYIFIALGNLTISIPLCKLYGGLGCAIGTSLAVLIGTGLIMNLYYHKKCGLDIKYFWGEILKIFPAFILPIVVGVMIASFVNLYSVFNLLVFGIIFVIVFGVSMWCLGLNQYEKGLMNSIARLVFEKLKLIK